MIRAHAPSREPVPLIEIPLSDVMDGRRALKREDIFLDLSSCRAQWRIQDFLSGVADLTEPYRNNRRQSRLRDRFVRFLNFKLKRPKMRGG